MADNFWSGVIVGWLVGVLLGFLLPVLGPLAGGFVAGWIARYPTLHRHPIHSPLAVPLLCALGSLMNVVKVGQLFDGTATRPAAIWASVEMFVLSVIYLAFGVLSPIPI